jgi:hypothetical protein
MHKEFMERRHDYSAVIKVRNTVGRVIGEGERMIL